MVHTDDDDDRCDHCDGGSDDDNDEDNYDDDNYDNQTQNQT